MQNHGQAIQFLELPIDLIELIFSFTRRDSAFNLRAACKSLRDIVNDILKKTEDPQKITSLNPIKLLEADTEEDLQQLIKDNCNAQTKYPLLVIKGKDNFLYQISGYDRDKDKVESIQLSNANTVHKQLIKQLKKPIMESDDRILISLLITQTLNIPLKTIATSSENKAYWQLINRLKNFIEPMQQLFEHKKLLCELEAASTKLQKSGLNNFINKELALWQKQEKPLWESDLEKLKGIHAALPIDAALNTQQSSLFSNINILSEKIMNTPSGHYYSSFQDYTRSTPRLRRKKGECTALFQRGKYHRHQSYWRPSLGYLVLCVLSLMSTSVPSYLLWRTLQVPNTSMARTPYSLSFALTLFLVAICLYFTIGAMVSIISACISGRDEVFSYIEHDLDALQPEHKKLFEQIKYQCPNEFNSIVQNKGIKTIKDLVMALETLLLNIPAHTTDLISRCIQLQGKIKEFIGMHKNNNGHSITEENRLENLAPWKKDIPSEHRLKKDIENYYTKFSLWSQQEKMSEAESKRDQEITIDIKHHETAPLLAKGAT